MAGTVNLVFAGVGGQGVLLIAEITARAAARAGFDVKQTEVHGVSQRGGSVESHVRFGAEVHSPLVMPGQADVVVGLEKLEALRYAHFVKSSNGLHTGSGEDTLHGVLLVNEHEIVPGSVVGAADKYPHHALDYLRQKGVRVVALPASQHARDLGDGRMANMVMLGAMSTLVTQVPREVWLDVMNERIPVKYRAQNLEAFQVGINLVSPEARVGEGEAGRSLP